MSEQQGHERRLADFIRQNEAAIVKEWIEFARTLSPASDKMSKLALEDHIVDILGFVADDLESAQTPRERFDKSRGNGPKDGPFSESAAEIHAALRLADGFDIDQMVSEYRALRASAQAMGAHHQGLASTDIDDLTRFDEAIDQAVTESVAHYTKTINNSRNLFLGRPGLGLTQSHRRGLHGRAVDGAGQNHESEAGEGSFGDQDGGGPGDTNPERFARSHALVFGTEIPIAKTKIDIAALCQEIADELRAINADRCFEVTHDGDPTGSWNETRLGQAMSNLMGNAIQYGEPDYREVAGNDPETVTVTVHNMGSPIP